MKFYLVNSCLLSLWILFCSLNLLYVQVYASGNETDRLALLRFKESITRDPHGVFHSWNDSLNFCNWVGIICSHRHQRVISLALQGKSLFGSISPYIGNLSFLRVIDLRNNSLHGEIPQEVGNLFRLQYFILRNNTLQGEIPVNVTRCFQLQILDLNYNTIVGNIPPEIDSLSKLEAVKLSANNLTGTIPASIANLSLLNEFRAAENNLEGNIPESIGQLTNLAEFVIFINMLSGTIPPTLFNLSSMLIISIVENQFNGTLPNNIGVTLPNLREFEFGSNQFSGSFPNSLSNVSQLQVLDIHGNNFVGPVPSDFGINLQYLFWLGIGFNNLGSNSSSDLKFLTSLRNCTNLQFLSFANNNFGGVLPNFAANLSTSLTKLYFGDNQISGNIPEELGSLTNLIMLAMGNNIFTGVLPSSFGKLQELQGLGLYGNRLSGQFPFIMGNLTQLSILDLSRNQFEGNIPSSIQNCTNLYLLDVSQNILGGPFPLGLSSILTKLYLSQNSFVGELPVEVGKLVSLNTLDISGNSFSGKIPNSIGECSSLENLYLQRNLFQGSIPSSLFSLKGLQRLDLSQNNLTGDIPINLQNLTFLQYLNLSFNHLQGEVPTEGVFRNVSLISLVGNDKLCGGIAELHLARCLTKATTKHSTSKLKIVIISELLSILSISTILIFSIMRKFKKKQPSETPTIDQLLKVSYTELYQATNGFSPSNLIGSGSFSSIYHGFFNEGERRIAVKVFNLQKQGVSKSITTECNALKNIRHRNLVKIITFCSSLDYKGNEFKALVLEFMENGSLEKWLHPTIDNENQPISLNFLQRLNIAIDIASALHYLHDLCERPIIHCDLKPSNVLLDENLVAHVSDFGLMRLLPPTNVFSHSQSSTFGIKGTIGYTAPKYGMGYAASKEGDVYSYGIMILEIFSGRKPTEEMFKDGLNLHDFVKSALCQGLFMQIVNPRLLQHGTESANIHNEIEEETNNNELNLTQMGDVQNCLVSILKIGVHCSSESPKERMNMADVTRKLHMIKDTILGQQRQEAGPSRRAEYGMGYAASKEGDIYSYGIMILEMVLGRRPTEKMFIDGLNLHGFVKSALSQGLFMQIVNPRLLQQGTKGANIHNEIEEETNNNELNLTQMGYGDVQNCLVLVLKIGVHCSTESPKERMNMGDVIRELHAIKDTFLCQQRQEAGPSRRPGR